MHERQISPIGRPDGGTNLLGAILARLGIVAIVVVGVLIAPAGLPDLSLVSTSASPTASADPKPSPEIATWVAPRRALDSRPPAKVTPAAWTPEESTRPAVGIAPDARPTTEDLEEEGIHRSSSRPSDDSRPDTMLKRAFRSVKNGLRRLGGFMIVRGAQPPGDQRIPASFMPSRS